MKNNPKGFSDVSLVESTINKLVRTANRLKWLKEHTKSGNRTKEVSQDESNRRP